MPLYIIAPYSQAYTLGDNGIDILLDEKVFKIVGGRRYIDLCSWANFFSMETEMRQSAVGYAAARFVETRSPQLLIGLKQGVRCQAPGEKERCLVAIEDIDPTQRCWIFSPNPVAPTQHQVATIDLDAVLRAPVQAEPEGVSTRPGSRMGGVGFFVGLENLPVFPELANPPSSRACVLL